MKPLDCVGIDPTKQNTGKHDFKPLTPYQQEIVTSVKQMAKGLNGSGSIWHTDEELAQMAMAADPLRQKLGPDAVIAILEGRAAVIDTNPLNIPEGRGGIEYVLYADGDQYPVDHVRLDKPADQPITQEGSSMGEWKDIATAPKDGRLVMLYRPLAQLTNDPVVTIKKTTTQPRHCWPATIPNGCDGKNYTEGSCYATHWQPLPPPPADQPMTQEG